MVSADRQSLLDDIADVNRRLRDSLYAELDGRQVDAEESRSKRARLREQRRELEDMLADLAGREEAAAELEYGGAA